MLNTSKKGKAIAVNGDAELLFIDGSDFTKEKNELKFPKGMILPPVEKGEREVIYIAGPSGVGKSTLAKDYIKAYQKLHKKNDIYLFSKVTDDETLKGLKNIFKIPINEQIVTDPIDHTEMKDSLVLFDDIDTINNKAQSQALTQLISDVLEIGRHANISVIITSHLINGHDKKRSRTILNEAHRTVIFPRSTTAHNVSYFLKEYLGLKDKELLKRIMDLKTRWVCLSQRYPMYALTRDEAFCL